ncbi:thiosulfate:glutathione sulfurtransferase [Diretmus argenteus]
MVRGSLTPVGPSVSDSVVTYEQLRTMLSTHNIQLFDVRNPDEFQAGRIPEAVNIPCKLNHLEESLKLSPEHFELIFEVKHPGKDDDNIVFHCQSGNRSSKALNIARQLGFSRAKHFKGGYSEWTAREGKGVHG